MKKVCIVGASGKLGKYMVQHALERGYEVVGVCRPRSVDKLEAFADRITIVPGRTNDPEVIREAVAGCDGVLTVLVPWGMERYASGTAQAVLDHARPDARLVFSCGWHITKDGQDVLTVAEAVRKLTVAPRRILRLPLPRLAEGEAANLTVFDAETRWTFEERHIRSKSRNTPFVGFEMVGRAWAVYNKGRFVENEA